MKDFSLLLTILLLLRLSLFLLSPFIIILRYLGVIWNCVIDWLTLNYRAGANIYIIFFNNFIRYTPATSMCQHICHCDEIVTSTILHTSIPSLRSFPDTEHNGKFPDRTIQLKDISNVVSLRYLFPQFA